MKPARRRVMGEIKCKNDPPPSSLPNFSVCAPLPVFGCVVTPCYCTVMSLPPSPSPRLSLVCLLCSGSVQQGSVLFEKREKSPVPVGDAVSSPGGLGPRRPWQGGWGGTPLVLVLVHQLLVNHSVHIILETRTKKWMRGRPDRKGAWRVVEGRFEEIGLIGYLFGIDYRTTITFHLCVDHLFVLNTS